MTITFQLEDDLEHQLRIELGDLGVAARDALLLDAYRKGKLSVGRLAQTLGLGVLEVDHWLAKHGVALHYTFGELKKDEQTLREVRESSVQ